MNLTINNRSGSHTVGLGAGGHARVVLDILRTEGDLKVIGLLDPDPALRGTYVDGVEVLGGDELLEELVQTVKCAFIGLGSSGEPEPRRKLFDLATSHGLRVVAAIHPTAVVASTSSLGEGFTAMAGAIVNPGVTVGMNVIVNTGAIVDHDCVLHDHSHVAPGAVLSGGVTVGALAHVGLGACIREGVVVGDEAVIGAGAVVVDDVPAGATVVGVPARPLTRR